MGWERLLLVVVVGRGMSWRELEVVVPVLLLLRAGGKFMVEVVGAILGVCGFVGNQ